MGTNSLEAAAASTSVTGLAPAGASEVSAQAMIAFESDATSVPALNKTSAIQPLTSLLSAMRIATKSAPIPTIVH
ncbi:PE domain-containing protein [Mycobacterium simulans]|uniref:PE domain-containing protein n=1 Tax=Mycobacterium simulans TaxID=627089 RepID=UPI00174D0059|nr:PE domain-containing protein [Mycobacterium simulans]